VLNADGSSTPEGNELAGTIPASVSFPTREARTVSSAPSNRTLSGRNPRPRRQRILQATGIGNSTTIIDAEARVREPGFSLHERRVPFATLHRHMDC